LAGIGAAMSTATMMRAPLEGASAKPMKGLFPIMATPFTEAKAVDFEDLAKEVSFLVRCGVHGMVWPQNASGYRTLTKEDRMQGMDVLAKAAKGMKPALVFGVQAANQQQMLEFAEKAESLEPDALIAMPPYEAKTLDEYRAYYAALAKFTKRPVFIQTTGGARGVDPSVEFLVGLAREFPQLGYIKEEVAPVIDRMKELVKAKPVVKAVFSGNDSVGMTYEMRFGVDGSMPSAAISDVQSQIWDLYQGGQHAKARAMFACMLLITNAMRNVPNVTPYLMKKRGVFKTMVTRGRDVPLEPDQIQEIDWNFEALKPYLRA
jgi:dihydrodipicolinate synthase/N-acetylneuraminate lyase